MRPSTADTLILAAVLVFLWLAAWAGVCCDRR